MLIGFVFTPTDTNKKIGEKSHYTDTGKPVVSVLVSSE
jgi:hypothetical protein